MLLKFCWGDGLRVTTAVPSDIISLASGLGEMAQLQC